MVEYVCTYMYVALNISSIDLTTVTIASIFISDVDSDGNASERTEYMFR